VHLGCAFYDPSLSPPTPLTANSALVPYIPPHQSRTNAGGISSKPIQQGMRRPPRTLTLIPMTYTEILPQLLEQKLVEITPAKPLKPSILENQLGFQDQGPNAQSNPLPAHKGMVTR
ncbi:hypothetical protein CR513_47320, partial [Mucuna pruriens]